MSTRLPGTVSSDLDATYAIPDGPRGMLLEHWPMLQWVRQNASETEYYILRATEEVAGVTPGLQHYPRGHRPARDVEE
jgi:hypothetical protein